MNNLLFWLCALQIQFLIQIFRLVKLKNVNIQILYTMINQSKPPQSISIEEH